MPMIEYEYIIPQKFILCNCRASVCLCVLSSLQLKKMFLYSLKIKPTLRMFRCRLTKFLIYNFRQRFDSPQTIALITSLSNGYKIIKNARIQRGRVDKCRRINFIIISIMLELFMVSLNHVSLILLSSKQTSTKQFLSQFLCLMLA